VVRLARLHGRLGRARDDPDEEIRLCRIEYLGDDDWGFSRTDHRGLPSDSGHPNSALTGSRPAQHSWNLVTLRTSRRAITDSARDLEDRSSRWWGILPYYCYTAPKFK
jgi:hypothetical protein